MRWLVVQINRPDACGYTTDRRLAARAMHPARECVVTSMPDDLSEMAYVGPPLVEPEVPHG